MCMRTNFNAKVVTLFNMVLAVTVSSAVGIILGLFGLPFWLIGGSVATTAVITEHYLTVYPLAIIKYIQLPIKKDQQ